MMSDASFQPDWFSKPGDTVLTLMERRELTCDTLATKMHCSTSTVRGLLAGTVEIDGKLAEALSKVVGGSSDFWTKRQSAYLNALSRAAEAVSAETTTDWLRQFPLDDIAAYGWVQRYSNKNESLKAYLAYFGVRNPVEWKTRYADSVKSAAFRTSPSYTSKVGALSAWLRQAELEASNVFVAPWSPNLLRQRLEALRVLTKAKLPSYFLPRIRKICAEAGVAVVFVRPPSGCRASGATRFIGADKAMVALSFRHLSDDHFWFTFFHEIGHLLLHKKSMTFVDVDATPSGKMEREANEFSANILVPEIKRDDLMDLPPRRENIIRFAYSIGVSPGIVVGQMQHLGVIKNSQMNYLKRRFDWTQISALLPNL
jgi:HTH-type transcriptional regulator / antitoxin HigA